ncbi:hypothetical protein [Dolichospermum circinale]|uniref:hypothetical protein n=1 Tax=Dolichospermum circinale TaxID=109265 RepID=UPI003A8EF0D6
MQIYFIRKRRTFKDKCGIGQLKLIGTWDLHFYQIKQIKRVRIVKRSDGYYIQFCVDAERNIDINSDLVTSLSKVAH